jgi:hypothetical protein
VRPDAGLGERVALEAPLRRGKAERRELVAVEVVGGDEGKRSRAVRGLVEQVEAGDVAAPGVGVDRGPAVGAYAGAHQVAGGAEREVELELLLRPLGRRPGKTERLSDDVRAREHISGPGQEPCADGQVAAPDPVDGGFDVDAHVTAAPSRRA